MPITTRINHITELAQMAGSETTDGEAAVLRDTLVDNGWLDWDGDAAGGTLTATDEQWELAVGIMCARRHDIVDMIEEILHLACPMIGADEVARFDIDECVNAVLSGTAPSDDNEGSITDPVQAMVMGCIMNDGPWWTE